MYAGWDFVLYALLLVVVVLWNLFAKVLQRHHRRRPLGETLPPEMPEPPEPIPEPWGRAATAEFPPDWQGIPAPAPRAPDRSARERPPPSPARIRAKRWRSRAELRRSLVDMAVLGPPRALAPWDGGAAAADAGGNPRG